MEPRDFKDPGNEHRGVTLWMLNDRLERDELVRQLNEINGAGIGAVITRTFNGLRTEYLSDEWMTSLRAITDRAAELGMRVFFQAGYMPSGMPDLPPESAHHVLAVAGAGDVGEGDVVIADSGDRKFVERTRPHVLDMFNTAAVREYVKAAYEKTWFASFGDQFGNVIGSVWVDEPHFNPPNLPWGDVLTARFKESWGYAIEDCAPSLFEDVGEFRKVRHHYWRTVTELLLRGYFTEVSEWCEKHSVEFSGHLMGEDTLPAQISFTGACMPLYEKMQLPGIDHLTLSLNWSHWTRENAYRFVMTPKQCSSASNQLRDGRALAEMYGVSTQGITFEDRKWISDWFSILGINVRCLHGTFYSLRGRRKRIYAPHLSYQQPWWSKNRLISDYAARVSYALRQGTFAADVLVLHPVESAYTAFTPMTKQGYHHDATPPEVAKMNASLCGLSENLMMIHRGFEYGDEHIMAEHGAVDGASLRVGKMAYRVVALPSVATLRASTIDLLTRFMDAGGVVLAAGEMPTLIDGVEDARTNEFNARLTRVANEPAALASALRAAVAPDVTLEVATGAENVWLHERALGEKTIVFLANTSRTETVDAEVRIRGAGKLEEWDAGTGEVRPLGARVEDGATVVELAFPPVGSHLVVLDRSAGAADAGATPRAAGRVSTVEGAWRIERRDPNALTLDFCRLKKGDGAFGDVIPVVAVQQILQEDDPYEGPITLQFAFDVESVPKSLKVAIEDADAYGIVVNGNAVSYEGLRYYVDRSFLPVDITAHVREGANTIELTREFRALKRPSFGLARLYANVPGTEIESVYLVGEFATKGTVSKNAQRPQSVRYAPGFVVCAEPETTRGDLVADGYQFFAGTVELVASVDVTKGDGERVALRMPGLRCCVAEAIVNGTSAGTVAWQPNEIDITDAVKAGANEIRIRLTNTLRNLLGPHHRPLVEEEHNWGEVAYSGRFCRHTGATYPKWYVDRSKETDAWTDDYYFVRFGLYEPPQIVVEEE